MRRAARALTPRSPTHRGEPGEPPGGPGAAARLAERARSGDRGAFGCLYEEYAGTVHGVLLAYVGRGEAQDLVHEVFLLALRSIAGLQEPTRVGPWLCAIARNRALDLLRSPDRAPDPLPELSPELVSDEPEPTSAGEAEEILALVRELPAAYRETLVLRLALGLSGPEIAARTGLTHGSVRVNLCRGMKLLRERLAEEGWQ